MIIAFPFSGGNKHSYTDFESLNMITLEYPGHGQRYKEPLLSDIHDIVDDAIKSLEKITLDEEYIIYGHSMGALIGYLVCQKLQQLNRPGPIRLIVSGKNAPKIKFNAGISHLPENQFWDKIIAMGGVPQEFLNNKNVLHLFTPVLKSDFKSVEEYKYDADNQKLTVPIDVFYGSNESLDDLQIQAWREETDLNVDIVKLEGNHFFIYKHKEFFINHFKSVLSKENTL